MEYVEDVNPNSSYNHSENEGNNTSRTRLMHVVEGLPLLSVSFSLTVGDNVPEHANFINQVQRIMQRLSLQLQQMLWLLLFNALRQQRVFAAAQLL